MSRGEPEDSGVFRSCLLADLFAELAGGPVVGESVQDELEFVGDAG